MNTTQDQYTQLEQLSPEDIRELEEWLAIQDSLSDDKYGIVCARDTEWDWNN